MFIKKMAPKPWILSYSPSINDDGVTTLYNIVTHFE